MTESLIYKALPALALRGMVMFPKMRLHFEVGRSKSIAAVNAAVHNEQMIFLVTQRDISVDDPTPLELYKIGVIAEIKQVIRNPGSNNLRVVVEGVCRAKVLNILESDKYFIFDALRLESKKIRPTDSDYAQATVRMTKKIFDSYMEATAKQADGVASEVLFNEQPDYLADFIAMNALNDYRDRQMILEELGPVARLEKLCAILSRETELSLIEEDIEQKVQARLDKSQHEYYLREQIKVISEELGEGDDTVSEAEKYKQKILNLSLDEEIEKKLIKECDRLSKLQGSSPDANVVRTYLDECLSLPWNTYTEDNFDLKKARKILDDEHFGMDKVKDRFIEMLAVRALSEKTKGQIICLVGPPGVGKTSIVRSVAKAMGRKYVRMSLGGVKDEAEIRGHRKTYIGAMPGRIINALETAKSFNPIILLDEVDKLGNDYKGDPSSALLEALDPEQNNSFRDHYIEFPVDLSKVIFITTANDASAIPGPLYDRMEVIELSSYTLEEKLNIAKRHLVKKQRELHGLDGRSFRMSDSVLRFLIDSYTREAGVRRLEQLIAALCRKTAVKVASGEKGSASLTVDDVKAMLGPEKFRPDDISKTDLVGVVNGLAWTSVGGEMLQVEAVIMDGNGKLELTGSLGDVMKESAKAALSFIRSVASDYGIDSEVFKTKDIHIHVPQGAVPKDGPSAGVTISTALLSALTGVSVKHNIAMTGEISLTGRVMPIGGLKEKSMAAFKSGLDTVIIPAENESDLWEVDPAVKEKVNFVPVKRLEEVFSLALTAGFVKVKSKKRSSVKIEAQKNGLDSKNIQKGNGTGTMN
ncbi:MAG: endopeptidase La [Acutalibacteraceae bacterium]